MTEAKDYLDFLEQHRLMDDAQKYPLAAEYARSCKAEIARLRSALDESCKWLQRLAEAYDPEDTEKGKPAIDALRRADMDGYRNACGLDAALEGRE